MKKANSHKTNDLLSLIRDVFVVNGEMIEDNGEDSHAYSINERYGFFGVFDGCGGIGSRKYENYGNKTGAYLASRIVSEMSLEWFYDFCNQNINLSEKNINTILSSMNEFLLENLIIADNNTGQTLMKGSLAKKFPTTSSMILCEYQQKSLEAFFVWAGDSRGYIMAEEGLSQITIDDVAGDIDAMSNLSDDGRLTNVISASGNFKLNYKHLTISKPTIIITATDGCFGYFSTPMEFEYMLLKTLISSNNNQEWNAAMNKYISKFTGDDYTMCIATSGYKTFNTLKKTFLNRKNILEKEYISKLKTADQSKRMKLWNKYKTNYYRGDIQQ